MQSDSTLPIERRRNYKSVVDALVRCMVAVPAAPRLGLFAEMPNQACFGSRAPPALTLPPGRLFRRVSVFDKYWHQLQPLHLPSRRAVHYAQPQILSVCCLDLQDHEGGWPLRSGHWHLEGPFESKFLRTFFIHQVLTSSFVSTRRIVKEDGPGGLFTGAGPTVVRAMALNMGMLASNDQVRRSLRAQRVRRTGLPPPSAIRVIRAGCPYLGFCAAELLCCCVVFGHSSPHAALVIVPHQACLHDSCRLRSD